MSADNVIQTPGPAGQVFSPYGYADNNPVSLVDPTGRTYRGYEEEKEAKRQAEYARQNEIAHSGPHDRGRVFDSDDDFFLDAGDVWASAYEGWGNLAKDERYHSVDELMAQKFRDFQSKIPPVSKLTWIQNDFGASFESEYGMGDPSLAGGDGAGSGRSVSRKKHPLFADFGVDFPIFGFGGVSFDFQIGRNGHYIVPGMFIGSGGVSLGFGLGEPSEGLQSSVSGGYIIGGMATVPLVGEGTNSYGINVTTPGVAWEVMQWGINVDFTKMFNNIKAFLGF